MQHIAIGITYNGSSFHGWQRQAEVATVQGAIEQAAAKVANEPISIRVAGRTDAGVHATGQVAAFSSSASRSHHEWRRGINALTPQSIRIDWVAAVEPDFHPRYSATARRYVYLFHDQGRAHPLLPEQVWSCQPLQADAMHRAAQALLGEHDFSSFRGAGCQSLTPMRRVNRCDVTRRGEFVVMEIEANAFLLHMVRNIARAVHDIGSQASGSALPTTVVHSMQELLALRDRTRLGATAPPEGLYLAEISYPQFALPQPAGLPFI